MGVGCVFCTKLRVHGSKNNVSFTREHGCSLCKSTVVVVAVLDFCSITRGSIVVGCGCMMCVCVGGGWGWGWVCGCACVRACVCVNMCV